MTLGHIKGWKGCQWSQPSDWRIGACSLPSIPYPTLTARKEERLEVQSSVVNSLINCDYIMGLPWWLSDKESDYNADLGDTCLIPRV